MIQEFAPAKINLTLHVTGRRADDYHLLDSLVVFAGVGDRITVTPGPLSLDVMGPMGQGLSAGADNLVLRAARLLGVEAAITLEKHLPVSSGIGGGSSDAAATLRALSRFSGLPMPPIDQLLTLGADLPVCADPRARRMQGVGEVLNDVPRLPPYWLVLVNPGVPVATPAVFAALKQRDNPAMADLPPLRDVAALAHWLAASRNDLEAPAMEVQPVIAEVLAALRSDPGCLLARMSGSGATCFGIFANGVRAEAAAARLRRVPGWWVAAAAEDRSTAQAAR